MTGAETGAGTISDEQRAYFRAREVRKCSKTQTMGVLQMQEPTERAPNGQVGMTEQ